MSATLHLARQGVGIELRRGRFDVVVDGQVAGAIDYQETLELPLAPGHHDLRIRAGRYSSQEHPFDIADEEVVNFRCHGAMIWPRYVLSIFKPDLAISLRQE
jgi:hypothetical protein